MSTGDLSLIDLSLAAPEHPIVLEVLVCEEATVWFRNYKVFLNTFEQSPLSAETNTALYKCGHRADGTEVLKVGIDQHAV